jgi:hypothetical protein
MGSPLLWQTELTNAFTEMRFQRLDRTEPCVVLKGEVIVFCYRKRDEEIVETTRRDLARSHVSAKFPRRTNTCFAQSIKKALASQQVDRRVCNSG